VPKNYPNFSQYNSGALETILLRHLPIVVLFRASFRNWKPAGLIPLVEQTSRVMTLMSSVSYPALRAPLTSSSYLLLLSLCCCLKIAYCQFSKHERFQNLLVIPPNRVQQRSVGSCGKSMQNVCVCV